MDERPLQPVYDALQSVYDEVATMRSMRPNSPLLAPSAQSPRSKTDETVQPEQSMRPTISDLDLRELEYSDPDSHLSCPICHIPFVDPVFVDCGHYFCAECLERYWKTSHRPGDRKPCPACRSTVRSRKCAPRLIVNMCNDVEVKCPVKDCGQIMTRGTLESHMLLYCPERLFECPDTDCKDKTKRKHLLEGLCRHETHLECQCGDLVLHADLNMHREDQCSAENPNCLSCDQAVSSSDWETHTCELRRHCPGRDLGCDVLLDAIELEAHTRTCPMAKMAPHLKSYVASSLAPLQSELSRSQTRIQGLEAGLDTLLDTLETQTPQPQTSPLAEKPLSTPPPHTPPIHSPSPTTSQPQTPDPHQHHHLLSLHTSLHHTVTTLSTALADLTRTVAEVDARNSMLTINETLRLKEELGLLSSGLFGTRTQVQWLLNRERMNTVTTGTGGLERPGAADGSHAGNGVAGQAVSGGLGPLRPVRRTSGGGSGSGSGSGSLERVKL